MGNEITISEFAGIKIKNCIVEITTLKQNKETINEELDSRIVKQLNLRNLIKLVEEIININIMQCY